MKEREGDREPVRESEGERERDRELTRVKERERACARQRERASERARAVICFVICFVPCNCLERAFWVSAVQEQDVTCAVSCDMRGQLTNIVHACAA